MSKVIDLTGNKFGEWTVLERAESKKNRTMWLCKCECGCGTIRPVSSSNLRGGKTKSCGRITGNPNFAPKTKHGASREPWYPNWMSMVRRMTNPKEPAYQKYVLENGLTIEDDFVKDPWAFIEEIGEYPGKGYTVDRIDNEKGYLRGNIRWLSKGDQNKNKGIYAGSKSGVSGITVNKERRKWEVKIHHNKKSYFVGRYSDLNEAIKAQNTKKEEIGIKK